MIVDVDVEEFNFEIMFWEYSGFISVKEGMRFYVSKVYGVFRENGCRV